MNIEQLKIIVELISQLSNNAIIGLVIYLTADFLKSLLPAVVIITIAIKVIKLIRDTSTEKTFIQNIFRLTDEDTTYWNIEENQDKVLKQIIQKISKEQP